MDKFISTAKDAPEPCFCIGPQAGETICPCAIRQEQEFYSKHPLTPAKGQPMPRTIEYYIKRGDMDQELIMEQKEEISRLKHDNNNLTQTVRKLRQIAQNKIV